MHYYIHKTEDEDVLNIVIVRDENKASNYMKAFTVLLTEEYSAREGYNPYFIKEVESHLKNEIAQKRLMVFYNQEKKVYQLKGDHHVNIHEPLLIHETDSVLDALKYITLHNSIN